jgi:hypothetical protein
MAADAARIVLETTGRTALLKVVRSGDVSNLARIDPNAEPWGGTTAMARETIPHHLQDKQYESVLKVVHSGGLSRASTLGRGDCDAGETARTTIKTNRGDLLRITSLSLALIVIVFVGMTTVVVSAHAKTHATLVLTVPFQFTVGDRLLLPGTYSFEQLLDSAPGLNIIAIRSADGGVYQAAVTTTTQAAALPNRSRLVFKRYGNSFFLSQVWTKGKLVGLLLYRSRGETRLADQQAANEEVSVPAVADNAVIASLNSHRPATHSPAARGQF